MDANKIGAFIKELRISKNMTQKDLAEIINCTDKAISRWETGRGVPEVSLLVPLSKALGISVNELLMGERFNPSDMEINHEEIKEHVSVPEIISKTDETIVSVIMEKDNEIKKLNKDTIIFMILCCVQLLIIFVIPGIWEYYKGWGTAEVMIISTIINSFLIGLVKSKIKWMFPLFGTLVVISNMLYSSGDIGDVLGFAFLPWLAVGAVAIMTVCMAISPVIKFIVKLIKKKIK